MSVRIAIVDPLPMFRGGLSAVLERAGFAHDAPDDLVAWVRAGAGDLVLLTLRHAADWTLLEETCQARSRVAVIAVLDDPTVPAYLRALNAGAVGAVPRHAPADEIRAACVAVADGRTVLPIAVLRACLDPGRRRPRAAPSEREIEWLRELARGETMAQVATRAGYSERMMFRMLRSLYQRLDDGNRTEAIIFARDQGWL